MSDNGKLEGGWPAIPDGLTLAQGIDLALADPAYVGEQGKPRRCIALGSDGDRCRLRALRDALICPMHAGLLDASAGGRALAEKRRLAQERAEERVVERSLGVRASLAAQFQRQAEQVEAAVQHLLDAASNGDIRSAQLLLPYLDQALGKPTERRQEVPANERDLSDLSDEELASIVAEGRRARLHRVEGGAGGTPPNVRRAEGS